MNDKTTQLLEQLANKLGTTSEYLWSILIKQAPIEGVMVLMRWILVILIGIVLYKLHKKFMGNYKNTGRNYYNEHDELVGAPMLIVFIIWLFSLFVGIFDSGYAISAMINPEYWALNEVMDCLKE